MIDRSDPDLGDHTELVYTTGHETLGLIDPQARSDILAARSKSSSLRPPTS